MVWGEPGGEPARSLLTTRLLLSLWPPPRPWLKCSSTLNEPSHETHGHKRLTFKTVNQQCKGENRALNKHFTVKTGNVRFLCEMSKQDTVGCTYLRGNLVWSESSSVNGYNRMLLRFIANILLCASPIPTYFFRGQITSYKVHSFLGEARQSIDWTPSQLVHSSRKYYFNGQKKREMEKQSEKVRRSKGELCISTCSVPDQAYKRNTSISKHRNAHITTYLNPNERLGDCIISLEQLCFRCNLLVLWGISATSRHTPNYFSLPLAYRHNLCLTNNDITSSAGQWFKHDVQYCI